MTEEIDVKPALREGWEITIVRDQFDTTTYDNPISPESLRLTKEVPLELADKSVVGVELENVFGKCFADWKEYRCPRVLVHELSRLAPNFVFHAVSVGPYYLATPFDEFLTAIEAGQTYAAGILLDRLEELAGEGYLPPMLREPASWSVGTRTEYTHEAFFRLARMEWETGGEAINAFVQRLIRIFGGSRNLR